MGRFMARDYVTIREEQRHGETVWTKRESAGRSSIRTRQSDPTHRAVPHRGGRLGSPIQRVEVQIDGGPWMPATIDRSQEAEFAWKIWSIDWEKPTAGEHTITTRAIDTAGNVQPAMDDPRIAKKRTYWESNGQVTRRIRIG